MTDKTPKPKKMSLIEAIEILMKHTKNDLQGQGCGIRTAPTGETRKRAIEAYKRAYKHVHGVDCPEHEFY